MYQKLLHLKEQNVTLFLYIVLENVSYLKFLVFTLKKFNCELLV